VKILQSNPDFFSDSIISDLRTYILNIKTREGHLNKFEGTDVITKSRPKNVKKSSLDYD